MNLDIFEADKNSWILSAKDIKFKNNILECYLRRINGDFNYNKIEIHPLLLNKNLINDNGVFTYKLSREEDDTIMKQLFPKYEGPIIETLIINECQMLSVDIPKYNDSRGVTLDILKSYKLPPINVHMGYNKDNYHVSRFINAIRDSKHNIMKNITAANLEIFDNFINKYKNINENAWLLFVEDDVRPVNISIGTDLGKLYNVPVDAELIRPYIGQNTFCDIKNISYNLTYGGVYTHAIYISVKGCQKIINYANKYKWRFNADIDLFKLAKTCTGFPTGYDSWAFNFTNYTNRITPILLESEKIIMYSMSHIILNQTSLPCVPFNT